MAKTAMTRLFCLHGIKIMLNKNESKLQRSLID
jgi:hypothetical protein